MDPVPLHAANPGPMTGAGNWTWLVPGRVPTLIDAGVGHPDHLASLDAALAGGELAQIVVTHGHSDHASGITTLVRQRPQTRCLKMPWTERDDRWRVPWTPLADGDAVRAGDTTLMVLHTPGHAPDHLCFWHVETRTLFGGDLVIAGTTVYVPPAPHGDLAAYLTSLERVLSLSPARILPAHGEVIDDPEPLLRHYLAHRRRREEQIVEAVLGGRTRLDAIVAGVYTGLTEEARARACETVLAHLEKLEREGRAARRADDWAIVGR